MKMLGFTSTSAAVLLLLGTTAFSTGTTPATSSAAASCGDQAKDRPDRKELPFTDAGMAKMGNMPVGTAATSLPSVGDPGAFGPGDIRENTGEAQDMHDEAFSQLPHLVMMGDEVTRITASVIDITAASRAVNTFQEVSTSTGLVAGFYEEAQDGKDDRFRWTRFEWELPPPLLPDQFYSGRAFKNALLQYVCHVINADHVRVLIYGSRHHRHRRRRRYRRYRRRCCSGNLNSKNNRRIRRMLRLIADTDRILWGAWSQLKIWAVVASPFVGDGRKESVEVEMEASRTSPLRLQSAAEAPALLPTPAVPIAPWPQMADPSDDWPPVSPLTLLIPVETPAAAAPWPPLSRFPPAAAFGVAITIPLDSTPAAAAAAAAAPLLPALPVSMAVPLDAVDPLDVVDPLDTVNPLDAVYPLDHDVKMSSVDKTFAVAMDLHKSDKMMVPEGGWGDAIEADLERLELVAAAACPSERMAVRWILTEAVGLYPYTGYAQGSEYAALAIYRGMGRNKEASLSVFVQWASPTAWFQRSTVNGQPLQLEKGMRHSWKVLRQQSPTAHTWLGDETMDALYAEIFLSAVGSLCTCQGLPSDVVDCLIQKTLEAGENGPAVSLWVMHSLLAIAESDCKTKMDATPDLCIRARLVSAGQRITSFEDLERHAPMPLRSFVKGYQAAVFGVFGQMLMYFWRFIVGLVVALW